MYGDEDPDEMEINMEDQKNDMADIEFRTKQSLNRNIVMICALDQNFLIMKMNVGKYKKLITASATKDNSDVRKFIET